MNLPDKCDRGDAMRDDGIESMVVCGDKVAAKLACESKREAVREGDATPRFKIADGVGA